MNWKSILAHAAALFLFEYSVGFASGLFDLGGLVNAWNLLSFLLCAALFAHLALRVSQRRLAHACLVLVVYAALATVAAALLPPRLTGEATLFVILEWLQLLATAACGLLVGRRLRRTSGPLRQS